MADAMRELIADLFLTLDGFASGVGVGPYFGYFGPGLESWVRRAPPTSGVRRGASHLSGAGEALGLR
jgi:hypothetical protein